MGTCASGSCISESDRTDDSLRRPALFAPAPTWQQHTPGLHMGQASGELGLGTRFSAVPSTHLTDQVGAIKSASWSPQGTQAWAREQNRPSGAIKVHRVSEEKDRRQEA